MSTNKLPHYLLYGRTFVSSYTCHIRGYLVDHRTHRCAVVEQIHENPDIREQCLCRTIRPIPSINAVSMQLRCCSWTLCQGRIRWKISVALLGGCELLRCNMFPLSILYAPWWGHNTSSRGQESSFTTKNILPVSLFLAEWSTVLSYQFISLFLNPLPPRVLLSSEFFVVSD